MNGSFKKSYNKLIDSLKGIKNLENRHIINEINMIYQIVLGFTAKKYKEKYGSTDILGNISKEQEIRLIEVIEKDIELINQGLPFKDRKASLSLSFINFKQTNNGN